MAIPQFIIDGVSRGDYTAVFPEPVVDKPLNGRATMSLTALPGFLPDRLKRLLFYGNDGTTVVFAGLIFTREHDGVAQSEVAALTKMDCVDDSIYGDYGYITLEYTAPVTLKTVLEATIARGAGEYGITLDAGQVTGPTIASLSWKNKPISEAWRELSEKTNYAHRVHNLVLKFFVPGTDAAPYTITDAATNCKNLSWRDASTLPANRVLFTGGGTVPVTSSQTFTTDGVTRDGVTAFKVPYPVSNSLEIPWPSVAYLDGAAAHPVAPIADALNNRGIWAWAWDATTQTLYHDDDVDGVLTAGQVVGGPAFGFNGLADGAAVVYSAQLPFSRVINPLTIDNPTQYWLMDDVAGSIIRSIESEDAWIFGTPTLTGRGVTFNGSDSFLSFSTIATTTTWSLDFTITPDSSMADTVGLLWGNATVALLWIKASGLLSLRYSASDHTNNTPLVSGTKYRCRLEVIAGVCTFIINGATDGTCSGVPSSSPTRIGALDAGTWRLKGTLSDVAYYSGNALVSRRAAHYAASPSITWMETRDDIGTIEQGKEIGAAIIAQAALTKELTIVTDLDGSGGWLPGQALAVNLSSRSCVGSFILTNVRSTLTQFIDNTGGVVFRHWTHTLLAIDSPTRAPIGTDSGYLDGWRSIGGGGSGGGAGVGPVIDIGGGSGTFAGRTIFLGGDRLQRITVSSFPSGASTNTLHGGSSVWTPTAEDVGRLFYIRGMGVTDGNFGAALRVALVNLDGVDPDDPIKYVDFDFAPTAPVYADSLHIFAPPPLNDPFTIDATMVGNRLGIKARLLGGTEAHAWGFAVERI